MTTSIDQRAVRALAQITRMISSLDSAFRQRDPKLRHQELTRWESLTVAFLAAEVNPLEAGKFKKIRAATHGSRFDQAISRAKEQRDFLAALYSAIELYPQAVITVPPGMTATPSSAKRSKRAANAVFIIHGKDEVNLLRLEKLLRDGYGLDVTILRDRPGAAQTLIEMFEEEASPASYAFALLTPDDWIQSGKPNHFQARPNALFELGWFFGRLGRSRVSILLKEGTKVPSDLEGIRRIEFSENVEDKATSIESELHLAGVV